MVGNTNKRLSRIGIERFLDKWDKIQDAVTQHLRGKYYNILLKHKTYEEMKKSYVCHILNYPTVYTSAA